MFDEDALRAKNKWKYIDEVPNLPFRSFGELQDALDEGKYRLNVSYVAARQLAMFTNSAPEKLLNLILVLLPFIVILTLIIAAIFLGNYLLLLWIPVPFISSLMGNPMNPSRSIASLFNFVAFIGLIVSYWFGYQTFFWLCVAFFVPFVANRVMYKLNLRALERTLKNSEPLFLNQYQKCGLRLRNTETGEELWAFDI